MFVYQNINFITHDDSLMDESTPNPDMIMILPDCDIAAVRFRTQSLRKNSGVMGLANGLSLSRAALSRTRAASTERAASALSMSL
jgi:hypothetical protein